MEGNSWKILIYGERKSSQAVMLLCSESWEQGTFSGQESDFGGSGGAARGCGLTVTISPIPRIPASFLLPGISASPCCAGGGMPTVPGPLFPIQMAAAAQPRAAIGAGSRRDAQPSPACMRPESQSDSREGRCPCWAPRFGRGAGQNSPEPPGQNSHRAPNAR